MTDIQTSAPLTELLGRLDRRESKIGIIGLGYVGIPLALRFHEVGFPVLGFDIDEERVTTLIGGRSPIHHIPAADTAAMANDKFEATRAVKDRSAENNIVRA